MKLKRSLKNKLKKFLFVLPIIIVVFSLFCLPVSAATYIGNVGMPISQPTPFQNGGYIEVFFRTSSGYTCETYIVGAFSSLDNNSNVTDLYIDVDVNQRSIVLTGLGTTSVQEGVSVACSIADSNGNIFTYALQNPLTVNYTMDIMSVRCYGSCFFGQITNTHILANRYAFSVNYGNTARAEGLLQSILYAMPGEDYIIDSITDNADENASAIQDNADKNAQNVIENDDENAQAIQDNADENTDKILNGWENDVEVESGDTGSLENSEKEFIANNQQAADDEVNAATDNIFSSVRRLSSSFGAVGTMFRQLTVHVPDFNVFIYFSLIIGIVPLIVGMTINGLRSRDRASARQRQESAYKRGYNSGYTRGKGG